MYVDVSQPQSLLHFGNRSKPAQTRVLSFEIGDKKPFRCSDTSGFYLGSATTPKALFMALEGAATDEDGTGHIQCLLTEGFVRAMN